MEQLIGQNAPLPKDLIKDSNTQNFRADVVDASMQVPVIVDFWAPWCGPCKQLGPVLEKAVAQAKGAVRLVKINVDENQALAGQFRVQSIPAVFAFFQGRPVDGFMGAQPESQIKAFVEKLGKMSGGNQGTEIEEALRQAEELLAANDVANAAAIFQEILAHEPDRPEAFAGLIRCYIHAGQLDKAREFSSHAPDALRKHAKIIQVLAELEMAEKGQSLKGAIPGLEQRLAAEPKNHEIRYQLAEALFACGRREDAIEHLLASMRQDRKWNDEAARTLLVKFFDIMGPTDPLTLGGRRQLSSLLFS